MATKIDASTLEHAGPAFGAAPGSFGGTNDDVAALTFEQAREELSQVVARLEAGGEPLEGALALWERGEALASHCQVWLDGARARFEAVTAGADAASAMNASDAVPF